MRLPSSADSTEAVMLAFVCFPATSLSRVYVNGSVAVIVVIVSLYPISIFPIRALALKSLRSLSRAISRWRSPMPARCVWPDSSSTERWRLGSSRSRIARLSWTCFCSLRLFGSILVKKTGGGTAMGRSCRVSRPPDGVPFI